MAERMNERPAVSELAHENLMEEICADDIVARALKQVQQNAGAPGVDGMTVHDLGRHVRRHWPEIRDQLLSGTYSPQPVLRREIPKPGGGMRQLGIPTVLDRMIQQMVKQVLEQHWDRTFSEHSYGFRPGRSAHQAVARAQHYIEQGYHWVVDIDLEKFFDRVNHDRLMARLAQGVKDKRVLRLIGAFLRAGVLEDDLVSPLTEGTPQGGPLSPLLSNIVLDELDRELEFRGHRFVRYADDCNIYVGSERAGQRVMASVSRFITQKLKLRVNQRKSAVDRPSQRKFLGFSFTNETRPRRRIAPESLKRLHLRVRKLTRRARGVSLATVVMELASYLKGWRQYYGYCETPWVLTRQEGWIRRRLRSFVWTQWKTRQRREKRLRSLGLPAEDAARAARSRWGPWANSSDKPLQQALPNRYFSELGLPALVSQ